MAHGITERDSMFSVGETPWHGLGNVLAGDIRLQPGQALRESGLDWEVDTRPLFNESGRRSTHREIYRKDTNEVFGVVGPKYTQFQNEAMFDWFRPWVESGEAYFHTAGSLHGGHKVWALCKINRDNIVVGGKDEIAKFILLSNSHDGKTAIRAGFTPIRVVCANTLSMAHSKSNAANKLIRVRHTQKAEITLEKIRETMDLVDAEFNATAEQYNFLCNKQIASVADVRKYVKIVLGKERETDEDLSTRTKNIIEDILARVDHGIGQDMFPGTWWAAYNGVTEYLSYAQGNNADNRMRELWFGQSLNKNADALKAAVTLAA